MLTCPEKIRPGIHVFTTFADDIKYYLALQFCDNDEVLLKLFLLKVKSSMYEFMQLLRPFFTLTILFTNRTAYPITITIDYLAMA